MNMDKDEALRLIKAAQLMLLGKDNQPISDLYYALQTAIDSIEQMTENKGDCISREYMKKAIEQFFVREKYYHPHSKGRKTIPTEEFIKTIKNL